MGLQFQIFNGATATTAGPVKMATTNAIKTLMQIKLGATISGRILEWGISFDGTTAATPGVCELVSTGTVAATSLTAYAAADLNKFNAEAKLCGDPTTSLFVVSTSTSGFNTSGGVEGSITTTILYDGQLIAPTNQYVKQFPLGQQPVLNAGDYLRIRTTFGTTINCICYVTLEI